MLFTIIAVLVFVLYPLSSTCLVSQGVTIPSQRRYVRYWGQLCGHIQPVDTLPVDENVLAASASGAHKQLTDDLIDRENKAKLIEIGVPMMCQYCASGVPVIPSGVKVQGGRLLLLSISRLSTHKTLSLNRL